MADEKRQEIQAWLQGEKGTDLLPWCVTGIGAPIPSLEMLFLAVGTVVGGE